MITRDSIETTYSFFHQKQRVYEHSTMEWQKDDIEYSIALFTDDMNTELYTLLSQGRTDYLRDHKHFADDISDAMEQLEKML